MENNGLDWANLGTHLDARIKHLGLTQAEVQQRGGPSPAKVREIVNGRARVLSPSKRRDLERAVQWPPYAVDVALSGGQPEDAAKLPKPEGKVWIDFSHLDGKSYDPSDHTRVPTAAASNEDLDDLVATTSQILTARDLLASGRDVDGYAVLVGARFTLNSVIADLGAELQRRGTSPSGFGDVTGGEDHDRSATDPDTPATTEDTQDQAGEEQKTHALRRASSTAPTQGSDLAAADRNPQDLTANAHPHGPDRWPDGQPVYDEHWDQWKAWQGAGAPPGAWEAFRAAERQQAYDLAARFIPGPTDKERMTTAQDQAAEAPHAESGDDPA